MCGICGALNGDINDRTLQAATDTMIHRGPDEAGYYVDEDVALGMRRLSIIDVGGGTQPKTDERGNLQVVFNGEIYNYRELQAELRSAGHTFESNSDTEVIVHAYEEWGPASFDRLAGIFAIAIWDRREQQLVLSRDHLGVKPLYYSVQGKSVIFGSELKPVLALLGHTPPIDPQSAELFLRYTYVPAPRSIFQGISKLLPGHYLTADAESGRVTIAQYWNPLNVVEDRRDVTLSDAVDLVDEKLRASVHAQLVSDVPLGAFLSGGTDSSTVVAMMQRVSNSTTKTFSIGYEDAQYDESGYAGAVAQFLGTEHYSWIVTEADALAAVPQIPRYYDEPFADSSAIPTYLVSQLARRHVTVALSGDGGDELFGGYMRYPKMMQARHWWKVPEPLRTAFLNGGSSLPGAVGQAVSQKREAGTLRAPSLSEAYRNMMTKTRPELLTSLLNQETLQGANGEWPAHIFHGHDLDSAMSLTDLITYLPDDILTKVDRASMAHSLEARVPLLDPRFVESVLSLPASVRLTGSKTLLKTVLKRYIPDNLVERPKRGFSFPQREWLRSELRPYLLDYLSSGALRDHGLFNQETADRLVREHVHEVRDWSGTLWALLMFQMWYVEYRSAIPQIPLPVAIS